jgi:hypothetical protein
MKAKASPEQLADQAKFVFQGTVTKLHAVTNPAEIPLSDRTVVVRVDRVIHAPDALNDYAGHEVTVQLAPNEKVQEGQSFIFYTNGWIFGDSLAVQSVGHENATVPAVAALSSHPGDPAQSLKAREAMTQVARADLIVTGRVSAVRIPHEEARAAASAVGGGRTTERISEHAPFWQEAVIDVDAVHKGDAAKSVVVKFPSSTDVRWYNTPKFHPGQEGVFLLHKDQLAKEMPAAAAKTAMAPGIGPGMYTALNPADVQPLDELPRLLASLSGGA